MVISRKSFQKGICLSLFNDDFSRKKLGSYLKAKRLAQGLSQGKVANQLGLSAQMISNIERGTCAIPLYILAKLLKIYKISEGEMLPYILRVQEAVLRKQLFSKKA